MGKKKLSGVALLTGRERKVFDLAVQGLMNKEIADLLSISVSTVKIYRDQVNKKLGVHSTPELILYAVRHGWLTQQILTMMASRRQVERAEVVWSNGK